MAEEIRDLATRLASVEREVPTMRRAALAGGVFLLAALLGAFGLLVGYPRFLVLPQVISVARAPFVVEDAQGQRVMEVDARGDRAHLILFDRSGRKPAAALYYTAERGGELALCDQDGSVVCRLASTGNGGRLELFARSHSPGKQGDLVAALGSTDNGGQLQVFDKAGKLVVSEP